MPTQETQTVDNIIASRRALLMGGGAAAALAALTLATKPAAAASTVSAYTDNDILNFALNLEYLEANFYYLAAFGTTIDVASASSTAAGAAVLGINGVVGTNGSGTTAGIVANAGISGAPAASTYKVPFTNVAIAAYAVETAVEEGKHVSFLRSTLGSSAAVAQPLLNLTPANFLAIATAAGVPTSYKFNPYANDAFFLLGAYIFEDVGVSAYHGAAPLITGKSTVLPAAVGIHAVEAYHAGMIRTSINANDAGTGISAGFPAGTLTTVTGLISAFRNKAAQAVPQTPANPEDPSPDDYGLALQTVTLNGSKVTATQIVDADPVMETGFARSTTQVLNIVTGGGAATSGAKATGGFFPNGLNGLFT